MKKISKVFLYGGLFAAMLAIAACDGTGGTPTGGNHFVTYTGSTSQAAIDSTNAETLAVGASTNADRAKVNQENFADLQRVLTNLLTGSYTECGGTYSMPQDSNTVTFSNFCLMVNSDELILDGTLYVSDNGQMQTMKMSNFNLSVNGVEYTVTASFERDGNNNSMDFVGIDGKTYRIQDFVVQDSFVVPGGVDIVQGRFYHPDYGYVDMESTSPLVYETCSDILRPTSGKVVITGANGTDASVEYQGCSDYTVCTEQDTMCTTYQW